jgi:hypothetical protein
MPEGDYQANEPTVCMHDGFGQQKQAPRLGVMITFTSLTDSAADPYKQFYSMGTNAHKSFVPSADGKGVEVVAGGPSTTFAQQTNWHVFLRHLHDCSPNLAESLTNDVSPLDGMKFHMMSIAPPDERKGFTAQTGEGAAERKDTKISVPTALLDGNTPAVAPKATAKPATNGAPAPQTAAPAEADDDVQTAAINGISTVLEKQPAGCARLLLRTQTFAAVKKAAGDDVAQAVITSVFGSDEALGVVLGSLGYQISGTMVKPVA